MEDPIQRTREVTKIVTYWDCRSKGDRCKSRHQSYQTAMNCTKRISEPYEIFFNDEERNIRNRQIFESVIVGGEPMTHVGKRHDLSTTTVRSVIRKRLRGAGYGIYGMTLKQIREAFKSPDRIDGFIMASHANWFAEKRKSEYWTRKGMHRSLAFIGVNMPGVF